MPKILPVSSSFLSSPSGSSRATSGCTNTTLSYSATQQVIPPIYGTTSQIIPVFQIPPRSIGFKPSPGANLDSSNVFMGPIDNFYQLRSSSFPWPMNESSEVKVQRANNFLLLSLGHVPILSSVAWDASEQLLLDQFTPSQCSSPENTIPFCFLHISLG